MYITPRLPLKQSMPISGSQLDWQITLATFNTYLGTIGTHVSYSATPHVYAYNRHSKAESRRQQPHEEDARACRLRCHHRRNLHRRRLHLQRVLTTRQRQGRKQQIPHDACGPLIHLAVCHYKRNTSTQASKMVGLFLKLARAHHDVRGTLSKNGGTPPTK